MSAHHDCLCQIVLKNPRLVFFTHRHPQRMIIHKPSFSAALSHNRVPAYLLLAVCALAAPLSKQTRIRTNPVRIAGQGFADDARALMFDKSGRMVCEPNLATAQALCLLQMHESLARPSWTSSYHGSFPALLWSTPARCTQLCISYGLASPGRSGSAQTGPPQHHTGAVA